MNIKHLLIFCLFIIIQVKCSSGYVNYKVKCYEDYCDNWGTCYLRNNTRHCRCMKQYYTGRYCDEIVNHCIDNRFFQPCSQKGTKSCIPYFGARYCQCKSFYMGETCHIKAKGNYRESSFLAVYFFLRPVVRKNYRLWVVYKEPFDSVEYTVEIGYKTYTCLKNDFIEPVVLRETLALPMLTGSFEQRYCCLINHTFKSPGKKRVTLKVLTPNGLEEMVISIYSFVVNVQSYLDSAEMTGELPFHRYLRANDKCLPRAKANLNFCSPSDTPDGYRPIMRHGNHKYRIPIIVFPCTPEENVTIRHYYEGPDTKGQRISKKLENDTFITRDYPFGKIWLFITEVENTFGKANYTCYCGARYSGTPYNFIKPGIYIETGTDSVTLSSASSIVDIPHVLGSDYLIHNWTCHNCASFTSKDTKELTVNLNTEIGLSRYGSLYFTLTVQPKDAFLKEKGVWKKPFKSRDLTIVRKDVSGFGMVVKQSEGGMDGYLGSVEINRKSFSINVHVTDNLVGEEFCVSIYTEDRTSPPPNSACNSSALISKTAGDKNTADHVFIFNPQKEDKVAGDRKIFTYTVFLNYWNKSIFNGEYQTTAEGYKNYRIVQSFPVNERQIFEANVTLFTHAVCNITKFQMALTPTESIIHWAIYVRKLLEYTDQNVELKTSVGLDDNNQKQEVYIRYADSFCMENFFMGNASNRVEITQFTHHGMTDLTLSMPVKVPEPPSRKYSTQKFLEEIYKILRGQTGHFGFSMKFAIKHVDMNSLASIIFNTAGNFNFMKESNVNIFGTTNDDLYHEILEYIFDLKDLQFKMMEESQMLTSVFNYLSRGIQFPLNADTIIKMAKGYMAMCKQSEEIFKYYSVDSAETVLSYHRKKKVYSDNVRSVNRLFNQRKALHADLTYDFPFDGIILSEDNIIAEHYYDEALQGMNMEPYYKERNATNETLYALDGALFALRALLENKGHKCEFATFVDFEVYMVKITVNNTLYCAYNESSANKTHPTNINNNFVTADLTDIEYNNLKEGFGGYYISTPNPFSWEQTISNKLDCIVVAWSVTKDLKYKSQGFTFRYKIPFEKRIWTDVTANREINGKNIEENEITIYKVAFTSPIQPILQIYLADDVDDVIQFAYKIDEYPKISEIKSSTLALNQSKPFYKFEKIIRGAKDRYNVFFGFIPQTLPKITFKVSLFTVGCSMWDFSDQSWQESCELKDLKKKDQFTCHCFNSEQNPSVFTGLVQSYKIKTRHVTPPPDSFVFLLFKTYIIPITASFTLLVFLLLFFLAGYYDYFTSYKKKAIYLYSNRSHEQYVYLIVTVTGIKFDSGTTSRVGIVLYGDNVKSKRHILYGYNNNMPIMQNGSTDCFLMTTGKSLGELSGLYLWINYGGLSPSWYCEKVYVIEKTTDKQWVFYVNDWFSLNYHGPSGCSTYRVTPITQKEVIESYAVIQYEDLKRSHLWFSMLHSDYCGSTPRYGKVVIAFGALFLAGFFLLPLYEDGKGVFDNYTFGFEKTISNGMMVSLYILGYHGCCLILLWRNPINQRDIPWRYLALGAIFVWIVIAYLILFMKGQNVGTFYSVAWLSAFLLAFLIDIIVIQNILLIIRGIFWRWILKKEEHHALNCRIQSTMPVFEKQIDKEAIKKVMFFEVEYELEEVLKLKEKKVLNYKMIIPNLIICCLLLVIICSFHKVIAVKYKYHNLRSIKEMFVYGNYSKSMGLNAVITQDDIYRYIRTTLKYVIHWQKTTWLIDIHFKVMGAVLIRQNRFFNDTIEFDQVQCMNVNNYSLYRQCYQSSKNRVLDTNNYLPGWLVNGTNSNDSHEITEFWKIRRDGPFIYSNDSSSGTKTKTIKGKFYEIPASGYTTKLGRNVFIMHQVMDLLESNSWIDNKTQTIVIELFVFGPDSYFFNNVKIIFERSYLGPFYAYATIDVFYITFLNYYQRNTIMVFTICTLVAVSTYFIAVYFHHLFLKSLNGQYSLWIYIDITILALMLFWIYFYTKFNKTAEDLLVSYSSYRNDEYHSIDEIYPMYEKISTMSAFLCFLFILRMVSFVPLTSKIQLIIREIFKTFIVLFLWMFIIFLIYASLFAYSLNWTTTQCTWWLECILVSTARCFGKMAFPFPFNFKEIPFLMSLILWLWYPLLCLLFTLTSIISVKMLLKLQIEHKLSYKTRLHYTYINYIEESFGRRPDFLSTFRKIPLRKNKKKWKRSSLKNQSNLINLNQYQVQAQPSSKIEASKPETMEQLDAGTSKHSSIAENQNTTEQIPKSSSKDEVHVHRSESQLNSDQNVDSDEKVELKKTKSLP